MVRAVKVVGTLALVSAGAAAAIAAVVMGNDPQIALAGAGAVWVLGLTLYLLFSVAERSFEREKRRLQNAFQARRAELQDLAGRDELTQLQNRRFFYEQLQQELDLAIRYKRDLSMLMIDVDDLKLINDEFGHQVGDVVLRHLGKVLNQLAGERNVTARVGGDEFAVIMPGSSRKQADKLTHAIWDALAKEPICETEHASIFLGVSVGMGGYPWGGLTMDEIIHWADTKLYANKLERKGLNAQTDAADDQRLVAAVVDVLSSALDVRDKMTHRHARRVARMSAYVAKELKLTDDQVVQIEYAAALHDIGKIGVADNILHKDAALDHEEWKQMRLHSDLGYQILNGIDFLQDAAEIVYSHHERFDGTGYPRKLKGEETPLGARVFSIVDAYDAMTSRRPYREAMTHEEAMEEIRANSGTQFDPRVVEAFVGMMERNPDGLRKAVDDFGTRVMTDGTQNNAREYKPVAVPAALAEPELLALD
jgi:diguanylate cyclase (GGDEF)-like protein